LNNMNIVNIKYNFDDLKKVLNIKLLKLFVVIFDLTKVIK